MNELRMSELNDLLEKHPKSEWPKIWWSIMDENWPEELGEEPDGVLTEEGYYIAQRIVDMIGLKACMRYMNTEFNGMTDQMFDDVWDSAHDSKSALCYERSNNTEDRAKDCTNNCYSPIVAALRSVFFGGIGGLLAALLFEMLKLL